VSVIDLANDENPWRYQSIGELIGLNARPLPNGATHTTTAPLGIMQLEVYRLAPKTITAPRWSPRAASASKSTDRAAM
jgi:hypothetical protein